MVKTKQDFVNFIAGRIPDYAAMVQGSPSLNIEPDVWKSPAIMSEGVYEYSSDGTLWYIFISCNNPTETRCIWYTDKQTQTSVGTIPDDVFAKATASLEPYLRIRITTGNISCISSPANAAISIDGISQGVNSPYTLSNIPTGSHTISFALSGYNSCQTTVNVIADSTVTASCTLTPIATLGSIYCTTSPQGAEIFIDGADYGVKTPFTFNNWSGTHIITFKLSGYSDCSKTITVIAGSTVTASCTLTASCIPNWQCELPLNGYESDGCGNRRLNTACNPSVQITVSNVSAIDLGNGTIRISWVQNISGIVTINGYGSSKTINGLAGTQNITISPVSPGTYNLCVNPQGSDRVSLPIGVIIYGQKEYCNELDNPIQDLNSLIEFYKIYSKFDIIPTIVYDTDLNISELTLYPNNTYYFTYFDLASIAGRSAKVPSGMSFYMLLWAKGNYNTAFFGISWPSGVNSLPTSSIPIYAFSYDPSACTPFDVFRNYQTHMMIHESLHSITNIISNITGVTLPSIDTCVKGQPITLYLNCYLTTLNLITPEIYQAIKARFPV